MSMWLKFTLLCIRTLRLSTAVINIQAPTYIVNTSLPANESYAQICADKKADVLYALPAILDRIPKALRPLFEDVAMTYWKHDMTEPYKSEIEYFSQCTGISLPDMITVNLIYALTAMCTSIVAVDSEGKVYHARNWDFPSVLRNDTVSLIYVDADNNTLYEMATAFGYVGVPSGENAGFAITMDWRSTKEIPWTNILDLERGYFPDAWLIREALIKDQTFDAAVARLSKTKIIAPIYYIIAGVDGSNDGAIITRNQTAVNGPRINGTEYNAPLYLNQTGFVGNHGWYIVETNFDYWKPARDTRREAAIKMMDEMGQENVNFDNLFTVMSTPPVLVSGDDPHKLPTVFTSLYRPSLPGYYNITIRFDT